PIPMAAAFLSLALLRFLAFRGEIGRAKKNGHILFAPVPLFPFKAKTFSLFPLLAPFGAASLLAALLPHVMPGGFAPAQYESPVDIRYVIMPEDYYRHVDFQRAFSFRPLDQSWEGSEALIQEAYLRYYLGGDGLIAGSSSHDPNFWAADPFPLEELMFFLLDYDGASNQRFVSFRFANLWFDASGMAFFSAKEWGLVAMIFAAWMLDFSRSTRRPWPQNGRVKGRGLSFSGDKRAAA
ncbi:MAG: hypothetical protein FWC65_05970, partial [Treponema sp.]|nr:hypothetical protein [Treponema sp.]